MTMWLCSICALGQDLPYSDFIYGGSANGIVGKISDEFNVTPSGQVSYEIPIPVVAGTGGMAPKLSIVYNSSTKDGLFGYGFDLTGLSMISRAPRNVHDDGIAGYVSFGSNDRFLLDGTVSFLNVPSVVPAMSTVPRTIHTPRLPQVVTDIIPIPSRSRRRTD